MTTLEIDLREITDGQQNFEDLFKFVSSTVPDKDLSPQ